jgi:hypothetical protein
MEKTKMLPDPTSPPDLQRRRTPVESVEEKVAPEESPPLSTSTLIPLINPHPHFNSELRRFEILKELQSKPLQESNQ